MKKICILLTCIFVVSQVRAQTLSSFVIGSTGEQFSSATGSLEWTLGEIMTETYAKGSFYLTQGFQQPAVITVTSVEKIEEPKLWIYPNPTDGVLHIAATESGDYQVELFNLQGQKLIHKNFSISGDTQVQWVNLQEYTEAVYLLRISNTTTGKHSYHKVAKN
ncbi:MAG TPA: T9SS type A sorting domain-containing protein [Cyclobacteriaceae bacterium]